MKHKKINRISLNTCKRGKNLNDLALQCYLKCKGIFFWGGGEEGGHDGDS